MQDYSIFRCILDSSGCVLQPPSSPQTESINTVHLSELALPEAQYSPIALYSGSVICGQSSYKAVISRKIRCILAFHIPLTRGHLSDKPDFPGVPMKYKRGTVLGLNW